MERHMRGVWLVTWILVGQVAMQQGTVTQGVRTFPTREACEQARQQIARTAGQQPTTLQTTNPQTGQPTTVTYAIVWACQPGTNK